LLSELTRGTFNRVDVTSATSVATDSVAGLFEPATPSFMASANPPLQEPARFAQRPALYLTLVVFAAVVAAAYGFRTTSLFACQPPDDPESYLAYCQSEGFADYDYGAFWFDLEPGAVQAAASADVVFLGNSRTQFGLSADPASDWFVAAGTSFYLLGFGYDGNYRFAGPLLRKLGSNADVYVLNLDLFFESEPTPPAKAVMYQPSSEARYRQKKGLERLHVFACSSFPSLCGQSAAIYRDRNTGRWRINGGAFESAPVSYNEQADPDFVQTYVATAREFLEQLPVAAECQILTVVPTVGTPSKAAEEIATLLERTLVAPELNGLTTYDGSHLDSESATRWSTAFVEAASPHINRCLHPTAGSAVTRN